MGVPIVTLAGQSFASRVAASILTSVNMTYLITNNINEYRHLSIKLGTDSEYLRKTKDRLLQAIPQSPLFDCSGLSKNLEAIYSSLSNS
jgi:predicted O-linked N-acetylglucosamine transferase (SPINDLY family)